MSRHEGVFVMDGAQVRAELFAHRCAPLAAIVVIGGAGDGIPARRFAWEGYAALIVASEDCDLSRSAR